MIEKNVNHKLLNEDISAKALVELIDDNEDRLNMSGAILYHRFPLFSSGDSTIAARVMIISSKHGVLIFQCTEQTERTLNTDSIRIIKDELAQTNSLLYSILLTSRLLRRNPITLKFNVTPIIFAPHFSGSNSMFKADWEELMVSRNLGELETTLHSRESDEPLEDTIIKETMAILEGSKGIIRPKERAKKTELRNKGKILDLIDAEIANFDFEQKRAALFTLDGPQRIRGLAGTGKTIILTMKAALIHLQQPDADILYTFYTRSLYPFIKQLITRFYRHYSSRDPNWDKVHVLHAWGGPNLPGVYYTACMANNITPTPFSVAKSANRDPFVEVCESLNMKKLNALYDYSLLDEAQDFPKEFYRLCRQLTKGNKLIWAYDECQNIFDISIQDTKQTFGKDPNGKYYIDFSNLPPESLQDLVLHRCYRNPRRILVSAFAIGLGIYNDHRLIQIPENNEHWKDFGFQVTKGQSQVGDEMIVTRPLENSPLLKNELLDSSDVVKFQAFDKIPSECDFVAGSIFNDVSQNLLPEDILVISLDDRMAREYFNRISENLKMQGISTFNILEAPYYSTNFQVKDHVTLTTVYRAKGNEAGSVYVLGVDAAYVNKDSIRDRNRLFTAMTRAKGWVTLTGVGRYAGLFAKELETVLGTYPEFRFIMPDPNSLKVFQRDLSSSQAQLNRIERELESISEKLGISKDELLSRLMEKPDELMGKSDEQSTV